MIGINNPRFVDLSGKILYNGIKVKDCCGFKNNRAIWKLECVCGNFFTANSNQINSNLVKYCKHCKSNNRILEKTGLLFGNNCKVISHNRTETTKFGKLKQYFNVKCHCGFEWVLQNSHLGRVKECWKCGHKTSSPKIKGKNHWNYNSNLTDEQRFENRRHSINREIYLDILKRDGFRCILCNYNNDLTCHHLNGWDNFPNQRQNKSNIVTLCGLCHNQFHRKYGYGNNTEIQFEEFILLR